MNTEEILKKIENMPSEEVASIVKDALDAADIAYEEGTGEIVFSGLPLVKEGNK